MSLHTSTGVVRHNSTNIVRSTSVRDSSDEMSRHFVSCYFNVGGGDGRDKVRLGTNNHEDVEVVLTFDVAPGVQTQHTLRVGPSSLHNGVDSSLRLAIEVVEQ